MSRYRPYTRKRRGVGYRGSAVIPRGIPHGGNEGSTPATDVLRIKRKYERKK